jgi:uncharacterized protein (TIRG00374 family)
MKNQHIGHIKKRAIFEIIGLVVIAVLSYSQRSTLGDALNIIGGSNLYIVVLSVIVYWAALPLTAFSYQLLTKKHIPMLTTTLAQLSGSGPGRIIPGGFGRLGLIILHLRKVGIPTQVAVVASIMNGLVGVIVNSLILLVLVFQHPNIQAHFQYGTGVFTILLVVIPIFILFGLTESIHRKKHGYKPLRKLSKEWRGQIRLLRTNPIRIVYLVVIALLILASNLIILMLAAKAADMPLQINDAIIALSVGVFVGGILPTPGGLGGVEAGTASALVALGYEPTLSTGVAVLFRMVTYWQPLIPGTLAYLYLREKKLL